MVPEAREQDPKFKTTNPALLPCAYWQAVFSGGDIVKQLPQEAKRFQNIDKNYMKIVTNALETLNVVKTCYGNELMKTMLPHLLEQLELCQKVCLCTSC